MTKKALYIFNPEHDLALASGETNYMAPASARRMASELALLPMWYAEEGSAVLASSAYNLDYLKQMQELLGVSIHLMTEPELAVGPDLDIRPWGGGCSFAETAFRAGRGRSPASFYGAIKRFAGILPSF